MRIFRKNGDSITMTANQKKLFPIAFEYAQKHGLSCVKVNRTLFEFDFVNKTFSVKSPDDSTPFNFCFE